MISHRSLLVFAACALSLTGCEPTVEASTRCISSGPWAQSGSSACSSHPWCEGQDAPAECQLADCVIENVTVYRDDGVMLDVGILHSASEQLFSRGAPPVEGTWSITSDRKFKRGEIEAPFECTEEALYLGDGPFRAKQKRIVGAMSEALITAATTGSWTGISY